MKRIQILAVVCAIVLGAAASAQTPSVKLAKYKGWGANKLLFNSQIQLVGNKNYYFLNLLQGRPDKQGQTRSVINLSGRMNFGNDPINFLNMKVNGIALNRIEHQMKNIRTWKKGNAAGSEVALNFDGAKILMNTYVKEDSPLLYFTFTQPEKQLEPIRGKVSISFSAVVSRFLIQKGRSIFSNAYNREALTAVRKLKQQKKPFPLTAQDAYLIFSDAVLDGSGKEKGIGPCLLVFELKDGITGSLHMPNSWITRTEFSLPADFKEFKCALFMQKGAISNSAFMKKFNDEKGVLTKLD